MMHTSLFDSGIVVALEGLRWQRCVLKNRSPKVPVFCKRIPSGVEHNRLELLRMLITVKTSLVNRGNLRYATFRDDVGREFASFLSGN
ncbi:hypothetical protein BBJ28_00000022 [Nothophytophthora sp. Chile5]|nr:hypothetical protein BBJ28_00000022 [Nothophytophthora sp. Chile5]